MKKNVKKRKIKIYSIYTILVIVILIGMIISFIVADNNMHKTNFFCSAEFLNIDKLKSGIIDINFMEKTYFIDFLYLNQAIDSFKNTISMDVQDLFG